jgi:hypothetical protein
MKRHVTQKFLGITILSLMLAVSSRGNLQSPPSLDDPSESDTTDPADTNSLAIIGTNSPAPAASPVVVPSNINPNSPLGQVVRMLQSGVDESVILAYVYNINVPFSLNSDQIIYLNDLGAPSDLVTAMIQHDQQLGVAVNPQPNPPSQETWPPPEVVGQPPDEPDSPMDDTNEPPPDMTESSFYGALAPYGVWVSLPGYGLCWQPCAGVHTPGWRPYCTQGQWVYSNCGWYWMSRYSWGWCTFHYGRWFCDAHRGWCWYPGTTWAPAWVCWRNSGNVCGWAPLPPHCNYLQGKGLVFNGVTAPADSNLGLNAIQFTFVPTRDLTMAHPDRFRLESRQALDAFNQTKVANDFNVNNLTFLNKGVPAKQVASATGRAVQMYNIQPVKGTSPIGGRGEQVQADGQTLVVTRPNFNAHAAATLNQGIRPVLAESQHIGQPATLVIYPNGNRYAMHNQGNNYTYRNPGSANGQVTRVFSPGSQSPRSAGTSDGTHWSVPLQAPAPADNRSRYASPHLEGQSPAQSPQPYQSQQYGQSYQGTAQAATSSRAGSYAPNNSGYSAPVAPTYSPPAAPTYSGPTASGYASFGVARGH